jgi:hypothetical protein
MFHTRIQAIKNQALITSLIVIALWLAWELGGKIVAEDTRWMIYAALGLVACAVIVTTIRNWRTGFYLFFVWLMFEDLVRKYMGNSTVLFFGKDVLLVFVYLAFLTEVRRGREKTFRPPFLLSLSFFIWLGVLQVFNQNSPHILYGLLGLKLYFYYVPLVFLGYALIRTDEDLRSFLVANAAVAGVIGTLGIVQAIVGNSFMNPATLAPELKVLGDLQKVSPLSGQLFSLPDSVFVSSGRFGEYLIVASIITMGTAAYLLFYTHRHRKLVFSVVGLLVVATLLSGSRNALVGVVTSAVSFSVAFLWGAPWRQRQPYRVVKAIRRSLIVAALALAALLILYPEEAGSRLAYYTETLNPSSSVYEGGSRFRDYPIQNFLDAFTKSHWIVGNGIGTASLGGQYVAKLLGTPQFNIGVEEGYGQLIIEMGILAPFLWILWTAVLLYHSWKIVRSLRGTRLFAIGFAFFWYAFYLLYPMTYIVLSAYQNYICNAYLWLTVGILFRLPSILANPSVPAMNAQHPPPARREFLR